MSASKPIVAMNGDKASTPYDIWKEESPSHPFFAPEFQASLNRGLDTVKEAVSAFENLRDDMGRELDQDIERLLRDGKAMLNFHGSETHTISVLGDSGEGKSSLINSLLHVPGIAQTDDTGSACTSVVTEYRQKAQDHTAPITIEVEYLSSSQIEDLVRKLLWSYRQLYLPGVESDHILDEDHAQYLKESEHAWSALHSAFQHQPNFTRAFLQEMSEGALERITNEVIQWTKSIEWPDGGVSGRWTSSATTADECSEKTKLFMQDKLWPFTKIIRVYLDSRVLRSGVVLTDLPGLQDTNLARVRATQNYLTKCDKIFAVAKISRAITDQSVKSALASDISRHIPLEWEKAGTKHLTVAVVCTKSEDINHTAARAQFCGPGKIISNDIMECLDAEIRTAKLEGDKARKKAAKRKQEYLLIDARNQRVKEGLQRSYAAETSAGTLDVFCVSNTVYEKYSRKGNTELVEASQIPELRKFCQSVAAASQLLEAQNFLQSKLPSFLNSLSLWSTGASDGYRNEVGERGDSIRAALVVATQKVPRRIFNFQKRFMSRFNSDLVRYSGNRDRHWRKAAMKEAERWSEWHWTKYSASCLKFGYHKPRGGEGVDWNALIISKMCAELEDSWDNIEQDIPLVFATLSSKITELLPNVALAASGSSSSEWIDLLQLGARIQDFEYNLKRIQKKFARGVRRLRGFHSGSNADSNIFNQMIPTYQLAASEGGPGMADRQRKIIQDGISDNKLFASLTTSLSASMKRVLNEAKIEIQTLASELLRHIKNDIDMAFESRHRTGKFTKSVDEMKAKMVERFRSHVQVLQAQHAPSAANEGN